MAVWHVMPEGAHPMSFASRKKVRAPVQPKRLALYLSRGTAACSALLCRSFSRACCYAASPKRSLVHFTGISVAERR